MNFKDKIDKRKVEKFLLDMRKLAVRRKFSPAEDLAAAVTYLKALLAAAQMAGFKKKEIIELLNDVLPSASTSDDDRDESVSVTTTVEQKGDTKSTTSNIMVRIDAGDPNISVDKILKDIRAKTGNDAPEELKEEIGKIVAKIKSGRSDDFFNDDRDDKDEKIIH